MMCDCSVFRIWWEGMVLVCGSVFLSPPTRSSLIPASPQLTMQYLLSTPSHSEEPKYLLLPFPEFCMLLLVMAGADDQNWLPQPWVWPEEMKLPARLMSEKIRSLHTCIDEEWSVLPRTACQTAAGRALWKHVIHDPVADVLAGENQLRNLYEKMRKDQLNNAKEVSGVILAVRTLWFDSKLEAAINSFSDRSAQVVLLGAGMDARAYRLRCLSQSSVFEVDFPELLQTKEELLQEVMALNDHQLALKASSLVRVAADIREDNWLEKLQMNGFSITKNTVWILEGLLYYLTNSHAMQVLQSIADICSTTQTVLLADFMNESSVSLSQSIFHFHCDWPEHLLPSLGFSDVKLSQIGDADAHFGLLHDPQNLFNKLRKLPRSLQINPEDGTPCRRLYLVEASGSPNRAMP